MQEKITEHMRKELMHMKALETLRVEKDKYILEMET